MNLKKIGLMIFILTVVAVSAFSQSTDEYVVVRMHQERNDDFWTYSFSNNKLNLTNSKEKYYIALASVCNYMFRNNYILFTLEPYSEGNLTFLIFRKK